jgi:hypothetical protein
MAGAATAFGLLGGALEDTASTLLDGDRADRDRPLQPNITVSKSELWGVSAVVRRPKWRDAQAMYVETSGGSGRFSKGDFQPLIFDDASLNDRVEVWSIHEGVDQMWRTRVLLGWVGDGDLREDPMTWEETQEARGES